MRLHTSNECINASSGTPMPLHDEKTIKGIMLFCDLCLVGHGTKKQYIACMLFVMEICLGTTFMESNVFV
jgi:hypothetical protein